MTNQTNTKNKRPTRISKNSAATVRILEDRRQRLRLLDRELKKLFPHSTIALHHSTPWELLVAVMLSAQCTDKKVNEVTSHLFAKYRTLEDYCAVSQAELEEDVRQTGFFRNKARHVRESARRVRDEFGGKVPCTMEELLTLPGVARKTANIVLGTVCGKVEGIAVDTHVRRFALRYDLTDHNDPVGIERDLMEVVPRKDWYVITYRIIEYGRQIAPARVYDVSKDPLIALYPKAAQRFRV